MAAITLTGIVPTAGAISDGMSISPPTTNTPFVSLTLGLSESGGANYVPKNFNLSALSYSGGLYNTAIPDRVDLRPSGGQVYPR